MHVLYLASFVLCIIFGKPLIADGLLIPFAAL